MKRPSPAPPIRRTADPSVRQENDFNEARTTTIKLDYACAATAIRCRTDHGPICRTSADGWRVLRAVGFACGAFRHGMQQVELNMRSAGTIALIAALVALAAWLLYSVEPEREPTPASGRSLPRETDTAPAPARAKPIESVPYIDFAEPKVVESTAESRTVNAGPAITSEQLAPLRIYLDASRDMDELEGRAAWDPERFGPMSAHLTLFVFADSDMGRATAFYEQKLLASVGRGPSHLVTDGSLARDVASLKEAWAISTTLHRRLEACIGHIRDHGTTATERQSLAARRDELAGTISTAVAQIAKISKTFYDRYGK